MSRRRHRKVRADIDGPLVVIDGRTYRPGSQVLRLPHTALQGRDVPHRPLRLQHHHRL